MKNTPHWQLLLLLYFVIVAVPVYATHIWLRKKLLQNRNYKNLLLYVVALFTIACAMNMLSMMIYFKFIFHK